MRAGTHNAQITIMSVANGFRFMAAFSSGGKGAG
jgi:hypothetical protein